jgi:hypothetical protein
MTRHLLVFLRKSYLHFTSWKHTQDHSCDSNPPQALFTKKLICFLTCPPLSMCPPVAPHFGFVPSSGLFTLHVSLAGETSENITKKATGAGIGRVDAMKRRRALEGLLQSMVEARSQNTQTEVPRLWEQSPYTGRSNDSSESEDNGSVQLRRHSSAVSSISQSAFYQRSASIGPRQEASGTSGLARLRLKKLQQGSCLSHRSAHQMRDRPASPPSWG